MFSTAAAPKIKLATGFWLNDDCAALADAYSDTEVRQINDQLNDDFRLILVKGYSKRLTKQKFRRW